MLGRFGSGNSFEPVRFGRLFSFSRRKGCVLPLVNCTFCPPSFLSPLDSISRPGLSRLGSRLIIILLSSLAPFSGRFLPSLGPLRLKSLSVATFYPLTARPPALPLILSHFDAVAAEDLEIQLLETGFGIGHRFVVVVQIEARCRPVVIRTDERNPRREVTTFD